MSRRTPTSGWKTPEYTRVRCNIDRIVSALQSNPAAKERLELKCEQEGWLEVCSNLTNKELVSFILGRIEQDVKQYDEFIAMLQDIKGMDLILKHLRSKVASFLSSLH